MSYQSFESFMRTLGPSIADELAIKFKKYDYLDTNNSTELIKFIAETSVLVNLEFLRKYHDWLINNLAGEVDLNK